MVLPHYPYLLLHQATFDPTLPSEALRPHYIPSRPLHKPHAVGDVQGHFHPAYVPIYLYSVVATRLLTELSLIAWSKASLMPHSTTA